MAVNPIQIGYVILSLVIAIALIGVGLLIGGVIDATTQQIFQSQNLTGTTWDTLRNTATNYAQQGIQITLVAIILVAVSVILAVIFGFVGTIRGRAE